MLYPDTTTLSIRRCGVVIKNKKQYRLFAEDLKKILKVKKVKFPLVPKYQDDSLNE